MKEGSVTSPETRCDLTLNALSMLSLQRVRYT